MSMIRELSSKPTAPDSVERIGAIARVDDRMESSMKKLGAAGTVIIAFVAWCSAAGAEEKFQKLSGAQIRAKIAGMEVTDEVHWRDLYERGGKVTSTSMGRKRTGKWSVENDQLCVEFEKEPIALCYEVLVSGKKVKLLREGILPLEVVVEPPTGRI
jgi:hypothetical protein